MAPSIPQRDTATIKTYVDLFKPRVMSLVVFTGFVGLWLAPGTLSAWQAALAITCIALNAGAAGAINMWYDADIDQLMERTALRPIPSGKVRAKQPFIWGGVSLASALLMAVVTNWAAAGLLVAANLYYVVIYTMWLKRRTAQNIVIGGAAGAFPHDWLGGCIRGCNAGALYAVFADFIWTPPHFGAWPSIVRGTMARRASP